MSYSKLNVFHWHITDSQSFPLKMDSLPGFAEFGAYSPEETYSQWQVEDIVQHAAKRGVRVLPELDAPAHVGAGWEAVDPSYTLCVNKEPWTDWCVEPPCGQLNPASSGMYDVLEKIYTEFINMFGDTQFHLGGAEREGEGGRRHHFHLEPFSPRICKENQEGWNVQPKAYFVEQWNDQGRAYPPDGPSNLCNPALDQLQGPGRPDHQDCCRERVQDDLQ